MIFAELKRLHSPDVNLELFSPKESDFFSILVQAFIGPKNNEGEEAFDIIVCTPRWFANVQFSNTSYKWGRAYLFIPEYNLDMVRDAIIKLCMQSTGSTWDEVAHKLGGYSIWEFQDYMNSEHVGHV